VAVYILSASAISPQDTFLPGEFLSSPVKPGERYFTCRHPEYRQYIDPTALRRMSPVIRMGLAASKAALEGAGIGMPGAIVVGSGLGCVQDTVKFLKQVIDQDEQLLNPTAFIQSTHNTVAGQIALSLGCRACNLTFTQKTLSFETALLDAMLQIEDRSVENVLVGGIDEIVEESHRLMVEGACMKEHPGEDPMECNTPGAVAGEGATFLVISRERNPGTLARIDGLEIIHRCSGHRELQEKLTVFLSRYGLDAGDIDLFVSGRNGDMRYASYYEEMEEHFAGSTVAAYKHLVGEYDTASAFGTYLAAKIIHGKRVPGAVLLNGKPGGQLSRALVFNYSKDRDFSFLLLSAPEP
jgi:3-oxoacyl-[acyl-carrier-protein] synthase II